MLSYIYFFSSLESFIKKKKQKNYTHFLQVYEGNCRGWDKSDRTGPGLQLWENVFLDLNGIIKVDFWGVDELSD